MLDKAMKQELPAARSRSLAIHGEEKSRCWRWVVTDWEPDERLRHSSG